MTQLRGVASMLLNKWKTDKWQYLKDYLPDANSWVKAGACVPMVSVATAAARGLEEVPDGGEELNHGELKEAAGTHPVSE